MWDRSEDAQARETARERYLRSIGEKLAKGSLRWDQLCGDEVGYFEDSIVCWS